MKNIPDYVPAFILLVISGVFLGLSISHVSQPVKGDMNNDSVLNITDLSILASVINEQG
jgi:hypothetical protein